MNEDKLEVVDELKEEMAKSLLKLVRDGITTVTVTAGKGKDDAPIETSVTVVAPSAYFTVAAQFIKDNPTSSVPTPSSAVGTLKKFADKLPFPATH